MLAGTYAESTRILRRSQGRSDCFDPRKRGTPTRPTANNDRTWARESSFGVPPSGGFEGPPAQPTPFQWPRNLRCRPNHFNPRKRGTPTRRAAHRGMTSVRKSLFGVPPSGGLEGPPAQPAPSQWPRNLRCRTDHFNPRKRGTPTRRTLHTTIGAWFASLHSDFHLPGGLDAEPLDSPALLRYHVRGQASCKQAPLLRHIEYMRVLRRGSTWSNRVGARSLPRGFAS